MLGQEQRYQCTWQSSDWTSAVDNELMRHRDDCIGMGRAAMGGVDRRDRGVF